MNRRGAVHGDRLDDAALNPIDEVGSAAGLDDVAAQSHCHGSAVAVAAGQMIAEPANFIGGELTGKSIDPVTDRDLRRRGPTHIMDKDLAGTRLQIVGFQSVQIERSHPCTSTPRK